MNKQRKGQFIWNYLAEQHNDDFVGRHLWNLSDSEFDKIMSEWAKQYTHGTAGS